MVLYQKYNSHSVLSTSDIMAISSTHTQSICLYYFCVRCLSKKIILCCVGGFSSTVTKLASVSLKKRSCSPTISLAFSPEFCVVKIRPELNMSCSDSALRPEDKSLHSQVEQGSLEWKQKHAGCMISATYCIQSLDLRLTVASSSLPYKIHTIKPHTLIYPLTTWHGHGRINQLEGCGENVCYIY